MSLRILLSESNNEYPAVPGGGSLSRKGLDFHYHSQPITAKTESSFLSEIDQWYQ